MGSRVKLSDVLDINAISAAFDDDDKDIRERFCPLLPELEQKTIHEHNARGTLLANIRSAQFQQVCP